MWHFTGCPRTMGCVLVIRSWNLFELQCVSENIWPNLPLSGWIPPSLGTSVCVFRAKPTYPCHFSDLKSDNLDSSIEPFIRSVTLSKFLKYPRPSFLMCKRTLWHLAFFTQLHTWEIVSYQYLQSCLVFNVCARTYTHLHAHAQMLHYFISPLST